MAKIIKFSRLPSRQGFRKHFVAPIFLPPLSESILQTVLAFQLLNGEKKRLSVCWWAENNLVRVHLVSGWTWVESFRGGRDFERVWVAKTSSRHFLRRWESLHLLHGKSELFPSMSPIYLDNSPNTFETMLQSALDFIGILMCFFEVLAARMSWANIAWTSVA